MSEYEAASKVLNILSSVSEFTDTLSMVDGVPALIFGLLLPEEWSMTLKTANMYVVGSTSQSEYGYTLFTMACRANTYKESRDIAHALHKAINRYYDDGLFITATISQTLGPSDAELDNFNTPVEILVRSN